MPVRTRPSPATHRSYDPAEVDSIIEELVVESEQLSEELAAALAKVHELESRPVAEPPTEILGRAMILVQEIADTIIADARVEAAAILRRAHTDADAPGTSSAPAPAQVPTPPSPEPARLAAPDPARPVAPVPNGRTAQAQSSPANVASELDARVEAIRAKLFNIVNPDAATPAEGTSEVASFDPPAPGARADLDAEAPIWAAPARAADQGDSDYFAALRRALDDNEPLGPRDEASGPRQNGSGPIGPVLRSLPIVLAVGAFALHLS